MASPTVCGRLGGWASATIALTALILLCVAIYLARTEAPESVPLSMFVIPILLGGYVLSLPTLSVLIGVIALALVGQLMTHGLDQFFVGAVIVIAVAPWSCSARFDSERPGVRGASAARCWSTFATG